MDAIVEIAKQIGGTYLLYMILAVLIADRLGIAKLWFEGRASRREASVAEQTRVVAEQQRLLDNLREEIDIQRRRRAEDDTRHEEELLDLGKRLGGRIDELTALLAEEQRNSSRWRHLINNVGMHIHHLRLLLDRNGIEAPRFDWTRFIAEGGDPSEVDIGS